MTEGRKHQDEDTPYPDDVVEYFEADGDGDGDGKRFVESGELSDVDDQTIAPPG